MKYRIFTEYEQDAFDKMDFITIFSGSSISKFVRGKDYLFLLLESGSSYEWYKSKDIRGKKYDGAYIDLNLDVKDVEINVLPTLVKADKKNIHIFDSDSKFFKISDVVNRLNILRLLFGDLYIEYDQDGIWEYLSQIEIKDDIDTNSEKQEQIVLLW